MFTIFFFFMAVSVIIIIVDMIRSRKHLDEETIRLFHLKQLSGSKYNRVITHLGICNKCQEFFTSYGTKRPLEDHLIDEK